MTKVTTVGLDLAKSVIQVHGADKEGRPVVRKKLRRPTNVVLVAMANKTARVVWAMLSRGEAFRAEARSAA